MSTRCQLIVCDDYRTVNMYRHYDGYPDEMLADIHRVLKQELSNIDRMVELFHDGDGRYEEIISKEDVKKRGLEGIILEQFLISPWPEQHLQEDLAYVYVVHLGYSNKYDFDESRIGEDSGVYVYAGNEYNSTWFNLKLLKVIPLKDMAVESEFHAALAEVTKLEE
jgi:hypothetical protein